MSKKIKLSIGGLVLVVPLLSVVSCASQNNETKPLASQSTDSYSSIQVKKISDSIYGATTLSTRTSIDESDLKKELTILEAKEKLGYDLTRVNFGMDNVKIVAIGNTKKMPSAWEGETLEQPYKFYDIYVTVKNSQGDIIFTNRFAYTLIVTDDEDVRGMFIEAKKIENAINASMSTKSGSDFAPVLDRLNFNDFKARIGFQDTVQISSGYEAKLYTDPYYYSVPGVMGKQLRIRFHMKKGNKEYFNFNSAFHERVLISSRDYIKMNTDQAFNWYTASESVRWDNIVDITKPGAFVFLNSRKLTFSAGDSVTPLQLSQMVMNYNNITEISREAELVAGYGVSTEFVVNEDISSESTSMNLTIKYLKNGIHQPHADKVVTIRR